MKITGRILSDKEKKSEIIVHVFLFIQVVVVLLMTYLFPDNILEASDPLTKLVHVVQGILPNFYIFAQYSDFPQVSQVVWSFELLMLPFWALGFHFGYISKPRTKDIRWFLAAIILLPVVFVFLFLVLPGDPDSIGLTGRITRAMLTSHFAFATWSSVFFMSMALCVSGTVAVAKHLLLIINSNHGGLDK